MQTVLKETTGVGAEHQQYLTFRLGEETFAMPILMIKAILENFFLFFRMSSKISSSIGATNFFPLYFKLFLPLF